VISVFYDPMISKLCAWGADRRAAIERMRRALAEYHVGGIRTNLPFHRQVMRHPAFVAGDYDTGFIERHRAELQPAGPTEAELDQAAIAAALQAARSVPGTDIDQGDEISVWRRELLPK
jgi:acetyl/propionyl-CoA carboxylase alpha subunit